MYLLRTYTIILLTAILLLGCSQETNHPSDEHSSPPTVVNEQPGGNDEEPGVEDEEEGSKDEEPIEVDEQPSVSLLDYFPNKPMEKDFLGTGNEFAQYKEMVLTNEGFYYPAIIDNGGTRMLRIYKVTNDGISTVYEQPEFYNENIPPLAPLEASFKEVPLLTLPLEIGKSIGEWKLVQVNETITVPYGKFNEVVVLEKVNQDGSINRQYWAKQFGKVKDEYSYQDQTGQSIEVLSELQAIR